MHLAGLDISLNSDLPPGIRAIVRLRADCSFESAHYEGVYLDLHKSMNGLRIASKSWLQTCSRILTEKVDLVTCMSEPTVMRGASKESGCPTAVMIYVDDLLVTSISVNEISDVPEALHAGNIESENDRNPHDVKRPRWDNRFSWTTHCTPCRIE